jgi:hypothetical protein
MLDLESDEVAGHNPRLPPVVLVILLLPVVVVLVVVPDLSKGEQNNQLREAGLNLAW